MNTYFGYVRVSTIKQGEGVSIDAQKDAIKTYAAQNGLELAAWYEEKETAAKAGRPVFNDMVKALKKRQAKGLIVHKIDRSARNFRDWARIGELADDGVDIRFATETLDFGSRGGRLSADIQAVIAADYIRNLREETRKGVEGQLKQGIYPFHAPLGYLNNGGGKIKTPDPERAPLIKEMFSLYATGRYTIMSLRAAMIERGLTNRQGAPPSKRLIEKTLGNPFYCGLIRIRTTGATYRGIHQPLITSQQFERIQDIKKNRFGKQHSRHDYLFRGLFQCGHCGYAMIAERQKGNVYYRCHTRRCATTSLREENIESHLNDLLDKFCLSEEAKEGVVAQVANWMEDKVQGNTQLQSKEAQLAEIDAKMEALTDALIDRLIDKETYSKRREKLLLEQLCIAEDIEKARKFLAAPDDVRKFLELMKNVAELYENLKPAEKRAFVEIVSSNRLVRGKKLELEPSKWLKPVLNCTAASYCAPSRPETRTAFGVSYVQIQSLVEASTGEIPELLTSIIKSELPEPNGGQF